MEDQNDKLQNYKILCRIKNPYQKTKYPYSYWAKDKITRTGNVINLKELLKKGGTSHKVYVF